MLVMEMVRRADHHEIERTRGEERGRGGEGSPWRDVALSENRQPDGRRIDIAGDIQLPADLRHRAQHVRNSLAKTDDGDAVGFHAQALLIMLQLRPQSLERQVRATQYEDRHVRFVTWREGAVDAPDDPDIAVVLHQRSHIAIKDDHHRSVITLWSPQIIIIL